MRFTRIQINDFYNLKNVDIDLKNGTALIVGPNGSGKSNIIKCVQFVLQALSSYRITNDIFVTGKLEEEVWDYKGGDAYIRIHAGLGRADVRLLCELRVFYIITHITDLACAIQDLLLKAVQKFCIEKGLNEKFEYKTGSDADNERVRDFVYENGRFKNIPDHYFNLIFDKTDAVHDLQHGLAMFKKESYFVGKQNIHELRKRIFELLPLKLLPDLLRWLPDVSAEFDPRAHDVDINCELSHIGGNLTVGISATDDFYLPCDVAREKDLILKLLHEIFGDVRSFGLQFKAKLRAHPSGIKDERDGTLDDALQWLLEPKYFPCTLEMVIFLESSYQNVVHFPQQWIGNKDDRRIFMESNSQLHKFVHSCVGKLPPLQDSFKNSFYGDDDTYTRRINAARFPLWVKATCVYDIIRYLSFSSSVQVLPQDRGLFGQESDVCSLTAMETEARLIQWKLSGDSHEQNRFKKVEDALKSLSGLKLEVIDTRITPPPTNDVDMEDLRLNLQESQVALQRQGWEKASQKLVKCQNLIGAQSPQRKLRLMVTRNMASSNSTVYSKTNPFTGCSGGEIELMMVLAAVYLNDADTVFLDEPGHSLHPPQQAQLRRWLETQRDPGQVLVTVTHAVEMISPTSLKSLYHMSFTGAGFTAFRLQVTGRPAKLASGTTTGALCLSESAAPYAGPPGETFLKSASPILDNPEESRISDRSSQEMFNPNQVGLSRETITMLMGTDMRKMFFATGLYLVEGETDKRVLSVLRQSMLEHAHKIRQESSDPRTLLQALKILEMDRWDILALGGCGNTLKAFTAAAELKIPCAVVLDGDAITVKHGTKLEPVTLENWNKSKLCKEMQKLHSSFACNIVQEFEKLSGATQSQREQKARDILMKHGFWVWSGDLETVVFDDREGRKKIKEIDHFVDFLEEELSCSLRRIAPTDRSQMSPRIALENFEQRIGEPLTDLLEKLQEELYAAHDARSKDGTKPVTESLRSVLAEAGKEIGKLNQGTKQHDDFCVKGTTESTSEGGPVDDGKLEEAFWRRVKTKFHNKGGWTKIPWEILKEVIEVSLEVQEGQLWNFCKFMKRHQCSGKPRKKELPQDLIARILATVDDTVDGEV